MRTALKITLWLAFGLEILSGLIWLLTIFYILPAIPLSVTVALFIVNLRSYREITRTGKISAKNIKLQTIFGSIVAAFFAFIVFAAINLDCMDTCTHPENYTLTHSLPVALLTFIISMALVLLPKFLNQRLLAQL